jgi:hypothetical protein
MAGKKGQKKRVWSDEEKLSVDFHAEVSRVFHREVSHL